MEAKKAHKWKVNEDSVCAVCATQKTHARNRTQGEYIEYTFPCGSVVQTSPRTARPLCGESASDYVVRVPKVRAVWIFKSEL